MLDRVMKWHSRKLDRAAEVQHLTSVILRLMDNCAAAAAIITPAIKDVTIDPRVSQTVIAT